MLVLLSVAGLAAAAIWLRQRRGRVHRRNFEVALDPADFRAAAVAPAGLRVDLRGWRWRHNTHPPIPWEQVRTVLARRYQLAAGEETLTTLLVQTTAGRVLLRADAWGFGSFEQGLTRFAAQRAAAVPVDPARGWYAPHLDRAGGGLWVGQEQLVQVQADGALALPWSELRRIEPALNGAVLWFDARWINLAAYAAPDEVAETAESRLFTLAAGADADQLTPESIKHWLGVSPRGSLGTTVPGSQVVPLLGTGLCLALSVVAATLRSAAWSAAAGAAPPNATGG